MDCTHRYILNALLAPFWHPKSFTRASHSFIHSFIHAAMQGTAQHIGSNLGWSVLPKDTTTDWEGVGFEPPTLRSLGKLLYLLSFTTSWLIYKFWYFSPHNGSASVKLHLPLWSEQRKFADDLRAKNVEKELKAG